MLGNAANTFHNQGINLIHLLLPFGSSIIVILGLMVLQRAQQKGLSPWTAMISLCWTCSIVFLALIPLGGHFVSVYRLYEPATVGALFVAGQLAIILAIRFGDVSIAAPVQGVKVLIVPAMSVFLLQEPFPAKNWIAACFAMFGVAMIQVTDNKVDRRKIFASTALATLGAVAMSFFDICIEGWAPAWKTGAFLPIAFLFAAIFATVFAPLADNPSTIRAKGQMKPLMAGSLLMAIQAIGMTVTLAQWGDAPQVNIVYSLRGMWGVVIPWILFRNLQDRTFSNRIMTMRLIGAILIGLAVLIVIL